MAVTATDSLSVLLLRVAGIILGLVLALQLLGETGVVPFDFTELYTIQQIIYGYILLLITILAFIEARTMQNKLGGGLEGFSIGVFITYGIAFIGLGLTVFVFVGGNASIFPLDTVGYAFDNGTINNLIGFYLLVGVLLLFINSRKSIFRVRRLFQSV